MSTTNLTRIETAHRAELVGELRYTVELDLSNAPDAAATTFGSRSTLRFTGTAGATTFVDLIADSVSSASLNGAPLDVAGYDGARLTIGPLAADNELVVDAACRYSVTGEGLHRFCDPQDGNTYLYTHYEPTDARRVFANFEQPDLKGRFTFRVTAPDGWQILSNQPEADRTTDSATVSGVAGATATVTFATTPPLSTYITAVAAGPYHRVDSEWTADRTDGSSQTVELALFCRAAMRDHLSADELLTVTRQGLSFYDREFGYPYPWGKYHQIFVPEYNIGAMENPGLVTFTEDYLPRGAATRPEREGRSNTILHEMAHMWFGDLVTMRWWDDLWLKESFADYMGTEVNSAATEFTDAWTPFASRRKAWAYLQDQLPTTHPIVATIDDVEAAQQNFDGITYAKGASVLKQLAAYVGQVAFFAGVRGYFAEHAFGNTTLTDLLRALEAVSDRDLSEWSAQWLQTAGISELTPVLRRAADGTLASLTIRQDATDPITGKSALRPHRLVVGLYADLDGRLQRTHRIELDVAGASTEVPEALGANPALVLVNDDDLSYAKVRIDGESLPVVRSQLASIPDSLSRAILWSALWNDTRDALLPAADFLLIARGQGLLEPDVGLMRDALSSARIAIESYTPAAERPAARSQLLATIRQRLDASEPGSDTQLVLARTLATVAATTREGSGPVRDLLYGGLTIDGLTIDPDLRWRLWQALAAVGETDEQELAIALSADDTMTGRTEQLRAVSSLPGADRKSANWHTMTTDSTLTNDQLSATITGFMQPFSAAERTDFVAPYFSMLKDIWASRSMVMASMLAEGLFPGGDLESGGVLDDHPVVVAADEWLDRQQDAPKALRRIVIEQTDGLRRALRAQAAG